jgi:hypothetical protein
MSYIPVIETPTNECTPRKDPGFEIVYKNVSISRITERIAIIISYRV